LPLSICNQTTHGECITIKEDLAKIVEYVLSVDPEPYLWLGVDLREVGYIGGGSRAIDDSGWI
jgi:hypothetical protein